MAGSKLQYDLAAQQEQYEQVYRLGDAEVLEDQGELGKELSEYESNEFIHG